jgi:ABC-type Mn2+/Zn2+ transport system permease subunit
MRNLLDSFSSPTFQRALIEAMLVGAIAGMIGVHVILRRLPFFVVAVSHATFPGVVIASALGVGVFIGGTAFGFVIVAAVLALGTSRVLDDSSVIGVVLAGSFALGVLIQSSQPGASKDLTAFLVGSVLTVTPGEIVVTAIVGTVVVAVLAGFHKELVLTAFDRSAAAALGYPTVLLDGLVLVAITVVMVTAIPAVGTLLAVALLTVPALTARLWTERIVPTMAVAALIGALSGFLGLCAAAIWSIAAGGAIALAAGGCFAVSAAVTLWGASARRRAARGALTAGA